MAKQFHLARKNEAGKVVAIIKSYPTAEQCRTHALEAGLVYTGGGIRWLDPRYTILEDLTWEEKSAT